MSRKSYQKGYGSNPIRTKDGLKFVIRYRERTSEGKWRHKAETLYGLSGKKAAQAKLDERIYKSSPKGATTPDLTLTQFIDTYWRPYLERQNVKPSTLQGYNSLLNQHITPSLGALMLTEIAPLHVERLLQSKLDLSPKTRRNLVGLLQGIFSLAEDDDLIEKSPVRGRHKLVVPKREKPIWTPEQVRAIIGSVPEHYRALFSCAALTGARLGELLALQWKHVDFDGRKLRIEQSLWRRRLVPPKTLGSFRTVLFGEALGKALTNHLQNSQHIGPEDFVFSKSDGSTLDPDVLRRDVLYPAVDRLGIPRSLRSAGFHIFRHSVGSFINAQTGNLKLAQKLLGHSNLSTTADIYTHTSEESEREAALAVERAIYGNLFSNLRTRTAADQFSRRDSDNSSTRNYK
jgi:integrase